jgi:hypothetical protein
MTLNTKSSFPAHGVVAVLAAALVSAALLLNPHGVGAADSAAQVDTATNQPIGAAASLSDGVDWSRVRLAPVLPGATVGAYDN